MAGQNRSHNPGLVDTTVVHVDLGKTEPCKRTVKRILRDTVRDDGVRPGVLTRDQSGKLRVRQKRLKRLTRNNNAGSLNTTVSVRERLTVSINLGKNLGSRIRPQRPAGSGQLGRTLKVHRRMETAVIDDDLSVLKCLTAKHLNRVSHSARGSGSVLGGKILLRLWGVSALRVNQIQFGNTQLLGNRGKLSNPGTIATHTRTDSGLGIKRAVASNLVHAGSGNREANHSGIRSDIRKVLDKTALGSFVLCERSSRNAGQLNRSSEIVNKFHC